MRSFSTISTAASVPAVAFQLVVPSSRIYSPIVDAIGRNALFVDRHDLTMRTDLSAVERYGRDFTDAVERQARALAVRVAYYNLCRLHELLGGDFGCNTTPAMAARVTDRVWSSAGSCRSARPVRGGVTGPGLSDSRPKLT